MGNIPPASSPKTDVVAIAGLLSPSEINVLGWLYITRQGDRWIQASDPGVLANILSRGGDKDLAAAIARAPARTYLQASFHGADLLREKQVDQILVVFCPDTAPQGQVTRAR